MARTGDQHLAFIQMSLAFPQLPGLMVLDILENRLVGGIKGEEISFEWSEPLGTTEDYLKFSFHDRLS